ncbi:unnamed protein product [Ectocarpus sp. 12 AP-2014]
MCRYRQHVSLALRLLRVLRTRENGRTTYTWNLEHNGKCGVAFTAFESSFVWVLRVGGMNFVRTCGQRASKVLQVSRRVCVAGTCHRHGAPTTPPYFLVARWFSRPVTR